MSEEAIVGRILFILFCVYHALPKRSRRYKKHDFNYDNHNYGNRVAKSRYNSDSNFSSMSINELFDKYNTSSDVPPLDSLIQWAYERGEIYSRGSRFTDLPESDKKTLLRIAINIGNKRKRKKNELADKLNST